MLRRIITTITNRGSRFNVTPVRVNSSENGADSIQLVSEDHVHDALRKNFPRATYIQVEDRSGGCGAMFDVSIEAHEFKGLSIMKQHRLVNDALKDLIKKMHGIKIITAEPPEY